MSDKAPGQRLEVVVRSQAVPAYQRLADQIQTQIIDGTLAPGDRLPTEPELSAHFQVSRNTAREALRVLSSQGLLDVRRGVGGGVFVAVPSKAAVSSSLHTSLGLLTTSAELSVSALVEVREMLEIPAAELAALRCDDDELAVIRSALFDPETVDAEQVFTCNRDFHVAMLNAAHNPLLPVVAQPLFDILSTRVERAAAARSFWRDVDTHHREIVSYVEARDQAGAREATRAHLRYLRAGYAQLDDSQVSDRKTN